MQPSSFPLGFSPSSFVGQLLFFAHATPFRQLQRLCSSSSLPVTLPECSGEKEHPTGYVFLLVLTCWESCARATRSTRCRDIRVKVLSSATLSFGGSLKIKRRIFFLRWLLVGILVLHLLGFTYCLGILAWSVKCMATKYARYFVMVATTSG